MYPYSRYYVDRYGNVIEVYDDSPSPFAVAAIAIVVGIVYALEQVWLWFQSHYILLGVISIFAFIAWVGWINLAFRKKIEVSFRGGLQGFFGILGIIALFNGSIAGYKKAGMETDLRRSIRGEWKQTDTPVDMKITNKQIVINSLTSGVRMDFEYTASMSDHDALILTCNGKVYSGKKSEKPQQTSISYWCQMNGEQLILTETATQDSYVFNRK